MESPCEAMQKVMRSSTQPQPARTVMSSALSSCPCSMQSTALTSLPMHLLDVCTAMRLNAVTGMRSVLQALSLNP